MWKQEQIIAKLDDLKTFCLESETEMIALPTGKNKAVTGKDRAELLDPLYDAVKGYYAKDVALEYQTMYVIEQLYSDLMKRAVVYCNSSFAPVYCTDYPDGYKDIRDIFIGGGALKEIVTITADIFLQSIIFDIQTETLECPLIDRWKTSVLFARQDELTHIEKIIDFCKTTGFQSGLILAFEEIGITQLTKTKQQTAEDIYLSAGYKELIQEFHLNVHIPTYLI